MLNRMIDELYETMPWDEIDSVVFDVGNVLLVFDPDRIMDGFIPDEWRPAVWERVFRSPYWVAMDHGRLSLREATDRFAGLLPEIAPQIRAMMADWLPMRKTVPEGVAALKRCREKGKRVCLLSNYVSEGFRVVEDGHDFLRDVDGAVVSSRVGVLKPDPRIYRILEARYDVCPARTLFVDDNAANVEAALSIGWNALWASSPARIARFFGV